MLRDIPGDVQIAHDLGAVAFDDQAIEGVVMRQLAAQTIERARVLEKGDGQIDRKLGRAALEEKVVPILKRPRDDGLGHGGEAGVAIVGNEEGGRDNTPYGMTHAQQGLGAAHDDGAGINLGLIPELEPARADRLGDVDDGIRRAIRQQGSDAVAQTLVRERREQRRQNGDPQPLRQTPDIRQRRRAPLGDREDLAAEVLLRQRPQGCACGLAPLGQDENDEIGRPYFESGPEISRAGALDDLEAEAA